MEHPKRIGDRTTLAIMAVLEESGYALFVPFGENTRYDLIIDDGRTLSRVQCKTGRLRLGAIRFAACSTYAHHPNPKVIRRSYIDEIDHFGVYCPETTGVYLVPIADIPVRREGALRVDPPRNSQRLGIRYVADYEVGELVLVCTPRAGQAALAIS